MCSAMLTAKSANLSPSEVSIWYLVVYNAALILNCVYLYLTQDISIATLDLTPPCLTVSMTPCEGVTENMVNTYFLEKDDQKRTLNNEHNNYSPHFAILCFDRTL